jgi:hypothetical protein
MIHAPSSSRCALWPPIPSLFDPAAPPSSFPLLLFAPLVLHAQEFGRDVLLHNGLLRQPIYPLLLFLHLFVLSKVLNVLGVRQVLHLGVFVVVPVPRYSLLALSLCFFSSSFPFLPPLFSFFFSFSFAFPLPTRRLSGLQTQVEKDNTSREKANK